VFPGLKIVGTTMPDGNPSGLDANSLTYSCDKWGSIGRFAEIPAEQAGRGNTRAASAVRRPIEASVCPACIHSPVFPASLFKTEKTLGPDCVMLMGTIAERCRAYPTVEVGVFPTALQPNPTAQRPLQTDFEESKLNGRNESSCAHVRRAARKRSNLRMTKAGR